MEADHTPQEAARISSIGSDDDTQLRHRSKRKRRRSKLGRGQEKPGSSSRQASLVSAQGAEVRRPVIPSCVLEFNSDMGREEVALRRALFVTVVGTRLKLKVSGVEVLEEVARNFGIDAGSMTIHQAMPEDFLLLLPDEETADRVLNGRRAFRGPLFSLAFKRWTRFAQASTTSMSGLVDIEIRGIPPHVWSLSTAEVILSGACLISELHPDTVRKADLSSFVVRVWCFHLEGLNWNMDLHITEPGVSSQGKRLLTYKISVIVVPAEGQSTSMEPPPTNAADDMQPEEDDDRGNPDFHSQLSGNNLVQKRSVHLRLGPQQPVME